MTTRGRPLPDRAGTWTTGLFSFSFLQHQNRHGSSWSWLQCVAYKLYWRRRRRDVPSWEGSPVPPRTLPFPRGAAPPVHVRHHVVQHVRQRVLDHGSPTHVAHLRGDEEKEEQKKYEMKIWKYEFTPLKKWAARWRHPVDKEGGKLSPAGTWGPSAGV